MTVPFSSEAIGGVQCRGEDPPTQTSRTSALKDRFESHPLLKLYSLERRLRVRSLGGVPASLRMAPWRARYRGDARPLPADLGVRSLQVTTRGGDYSVTTVFEVLQHEERETVTVPSLRGFVPRDQPGLQNPAP